jgi:hypothetical protein
MVGLGLRNRQRQDTPKHDTAKSGEYLRQISAI